MRRSLVVLAVLAAVLSAVIGVGPASAQSDLEAARSQLAEAEERIAQIQQAADRATDRYDASQARLGQLELEIGSLRRDIEGVEVEVATLESAVAEVAIARYTGVAAEGDLQALAHEDVNESARADFLVDFATGSGNDVIDDFRAATARLENRREALGQAETEQADQVDQLGAAQADVYAALDEMQGEYDGVVAVVANLEEEERRRLAEEARLAAAALAAAQAAAAPAPDSEPAGSAAAADPVDPVDPGDPGEPPPPVAELPPPVPAPSVGIICPVQGPVSFSDTWGAARSGGRSHQGVDMMAATGTPVVNPVGGTVELRGNSLGGLSFYLWGNDGNFYYGAHLNSYGSSGNLAGGNVVGYVGSSGNAGVPHLHFEIHIGGQGNAINPYPTTAAAC